MLPAWNRLRIDDRGCVWARRFQLPSDSIELWDVLDPSGRHLARVELPPRLMLNDVTDNVVVTRTTNDLGVDQIVGLSLSEPATQRTCRVPGTSAS